MTLTMEYINKEIELLGTIGEERRLMAAYNRKMFVLADMDSSDQAFAASIKVIDLMKKEEDALQKSFIYRQLCVFYHRVSELWRSVLKFQVDAHFGSTGVFAVSQVNAVVRGEQQKPFPA